MTLTHDEMQAALREARSVASATGRAVAVVSNDRARWFERRPRRWRIEANPTSDHQVIVSDVLPRLPSPEMIEASCAARAELPEAWEALRVLMNRCIKMPDGSQRTREDVEAMLIDLAAAISASEPAADVALDITARRVDLPGYQEPRS